MLQARVQVPLCLFQDDLGVGGCKETVFQSHGLDLPVPNRCLTCQGLYMLWFKTKYFDTIVSVKMFQMLYSHSAWEWKQNLKVLQVQVVTLCLAVIKTIVTVNKTRKRNRWKTPGRCTDFWPCLVQCYTFAVLHWNQIFEYLEAIIYTVCFDRYLMFIEELISCLSIFLLMHANTYL